jgi:hypothetical protein
MVVGMAMALEATPSSDGGLAVCMTGDVNPTRIMGANTADLWAPADFGMMTRSFTPIHITLVLVKRSAYGMFLWGLLPRLTGESLLLPSAASAVASLVVNLVFLLQLRLLFAEMLTVETVRRNLCVMPLAEDNYDFQDATVQPEPKTTLKLDIDLR